MTEAVLDENVAAPWPRSKCKGDKKAWKLHAVANQGCWTAFWGGSDEVGGPRPRKTDLEAEGARAASDQPERDRPRPLKPL